MLSVNIICIGKIKETYLKDAINEYSKRLSKYCKLTITELPDEKIPDKLNTKIEEDIKNKECTNILNHIKSDSYIIALDLKGKSLTSEEFSEKIENFWNKNERGKWGIAEEGTKYQTAAKDSESGQTERWADCREWISEKLSCQRIRLHRAAVGKCWTNAPFYWKECTGISEDGDRQSEEISSGAVWTEMQSQKERPHYITDENVRINAPKWYKYIDNANKIAYNKNVNKSMRWLQWHRQVSTCVWTKIWSVSLTASVPISGWVWPRRSAFSQKLLFGVRNRPTSTPPYSDLKHIAFAWTH